MPVIKSDYQAPLLFRNGHLNTIYPSLFRRPKVSAFEQQRLDTDDDDFLDLDWYVIGARRLVILSHGLEGHAQRPYILGMVNNFKDNHWDCLAWNFRSCSGIMNRQKRFYHSGATDDLARVIQCAEQIGRYDEIVLIGFSMGGNLTLLHAGREVADLSDLVIAAVGISVPCDLESCAEQLSLSQNSIYMKRFLRDLKVKMQAKQQLFPREIDTSDYHTIRNFHQFDDQFTAPIHGFKNAKDYWRQSSCLGYLNKISIPVLLVNARDDPFLADLAYPYDVAAGSDCLHFESPEHGGHVGFVSFQSQAYWIERRALAFVEQYSSY